MAHQHGWSLPLKGHAMRIGSTKRYTRLARPCAPQFHSHGATPLHVLCLLYSVDRQNCVIGTIALPPHRRRPSNYRAKGSNAPLFPWLATATLRSVQVARRRGRTDRPATTRPRRSGGGGKTTLRSWVSSTTCGRRSVPAQAVKRRCIRFGRKTAPAWTVTDAWATHLHLRAP